MIETDNEREQRRDQNHRDILMAKLKDAERLVETLRKEIKRLGG